MPATATATATPGGGTGGSAPATDVKRLEKPAPGRSLLDLATDVERVVSELVEAFPVASVAAWSVDADADAAEAVARVQRAVKTLVPWALDAAARSR